MKKVFERVKGEVNKRVKKLTKTKLNDVNLIHAIKKNVIPVAAYSMNICKFTDEELKQLGQVIKREQISKNMFGKESNNERLYLIREDGGRGIKSLRDIYKETKLRVTCYMACLQNKWIKAAQRRENTKKENSLVEEAIKTMEDVEAKIQFKEGNI